MRWARRARGGTGGGTGCRPPRGRTRRARCCRSSPRGCTQRRGGSSPGAAAYGQRQSIQRREEITYPERIDVLLAGHDLHRVEAVQEVHVVADLGRVALDADREEGRGAAGAVREHAQARAAERLRGHGGHERGEAAVERAGVHVAAAAGAVHRRLDALGEVRLGERDERLLGGLVRQRRLVRGLEHLLRVRDVGELRVLGVRHEVVVELGHDEHGT